MQSDYEIAEARAEMETARAAVDAKQKAIDERLAAIGENDPLLGVLRAELNQLNDVLRGARFRYYQLMDDAQPYR